MEEKNRRGGKREGSGRKPYPPGVKKVLYSMRIKPEIREYLQSRENATETVETAILRSKSYRTWMDGK